MRKRYKENRVMHEIETDGKRCPRVLGVCEHNSGSESHRKQQIL